ncbi:MAG: molecular chaperone DnaK, partial [Roseivirga sp.]
EANAESDKKEKEKIDKLNTADSLIFQTEKQLKDYGDKLSDENKKPIEEALANLKTAHGSQDADSIDAGLETLNKAWEAASQEMYAAQQAAEGGEQPGPDAGAGDAGSEEGSADDVSDVEYEEVK